MYHPLKRHRRWLHILSAFIIGSLLMLGSISISPSSASTNQNAQAEATYDCGNPWTNHCHGYVGWSGGTAGVYSRVSITNMLHSCCSGNFIRNKMWLIGGPGNSFIEVGYGTREDLKTQLNINEYFWADSRPAYQVYWYHDIGLVREGDLGSSANMQILRNGSDQYKIEISIGGRYYPNYSTDNTMYADYIDVGTQLSGTFGAWMPGEVHWYENTWFESNGTPHPQITSGNIGSSRPGPLYRRWIVVPSPGGTGDDFTVSCPTC